MIITGCKIRKWNETKKKNPYYFFAIWHLLFFYLHTATDIVHFKSSTHGKTNQFPIQLEFIFGMYTFTFCCYQIS